MKKSVLIFACLAFFFPLVIARTAAAAPDRRPPAVVKAETYLQSLKTVRARFVQTGPDGRQATGTFYLSRPGRLRFEYDPPVKDFVVADGHFIYFYDAELGQQSNAPIGQTLADFLLRKNLVLQDDVTVTDVRRNKTGLLLISLTQTADSAAGTLTLGLSEEPLQLRKWRITDGTGAITEVELTEFQPNVQLPDGLFAYRAPAGSRQQFNQ